MNQIEIFNILKGGMLVAAMVGLDARSTMDLDATIKGAMRVTAGLRMQSSFWQSGSTLPRPDECAVRMM